MPDEDLKLPGPLAEARPLVLLALSTLTQFQKSLELLCPLDEPQADWGLWCAGLALRGLEGDEVAWNQLVTVLEAHNHPVLGRPAEFNRALQQLRQMAPETGFLGDLGLFLSSTRPELIAAGRLWQLYETLSQGEHVVPQADLTLPPDVRQTMLLACDAFVLALLLSALLFLFAFDPGAKSFPDTPGIYRRLSDRQKLCIAGLESKIREKEPLYTVSGAGLFQVAGIRCASGHQACLEVARQSLRVPTQEGYSRVWFENASRRGQVDWATLPAKPNHMHLCREILLLYPDKPETMIEAVFVEASSVAAQSDVRPIPQGESGPYRFEAPNEFYWKDSPPVHLSATEVRLLQYCLRNRRTEVQQVVDEVWGHDAGSEKSDSALDTTKSRVNSKLAEAEIPISLTRKAGWMITDVDS